MIVTLIPSREALLAELLPTLWVEEGLGDKVASILAELENLGYEISRQVEVFGPMEEALRQLDDPDGVRSVLIDRDRPRRIGRPRRHLNILDELLVDEARASIALDKTGDGQTFSIDPESHT